LEQIETADQNNDSSELAPQPRWVFPDFLQHPPPRGPNDPPLKLAPGQDVPLSEIENYWEWAEQNPLPKTAEENSHATSLAQSEDPEKKTES